MTTEADIVAQVRDLGVRNVPAAIVGGGTRRAVGRPVQAAAEIVTAGLTGITLYEPAEMVIAARAGTPLAQVEAVLAERGQMLPFEPGDWRDLMGTSGVPTIGAVVAMNLSGPRRIAAGACRDSLIGVRLVNGRGEAIQSGGRVMKNVTGLDLVKVIAGSYGTLGVITEATFKVLPRPQATLTLALSGLDDARAVTALSLALGSPFEPSGAAHLPAGMGGALSDATQTLVRVEGIAESIDYRFGRLAELLKAFGPAQRLEPGQAAALWRDIADVRLLAEPRDAAVWRLSLAPGHAPRTVSAIASHLPCRVVYDGGGGLVWLSCPASGDAGADIIRAAIAQVAGHDGHATLIRAPEAVRAAVAVFQPLPGPVMALQRGVKSSFDPAGLFAPGRMYAGM